MRYKMVKMEVKEERKKKRRRERKKKQVEQNKMRK
jgi:hypothetical protein